VDVPVTGVEVRVLSRAPLKTAKESGEKHRRKPFSFGAGKTRSEFVSGKRKLFGIQMQEFFCLTRGFAMSYASSRPACLGQERADEKTFGKSELAERGPETLIASTTNGQDTRQE